MNPDNQWFNKRDHDTTNLTIKQIEAEMENTYLQSKVFEVLKMYRSGLISKAEYKQFSKKIKKQRYPYEAEA